MSLLDEYQLRRIVAATAQLGKKRVEHRPWQGRRAAHYPEIFIRTAAHEHIAVVGRNVENVIVGIEPQEERHLELARLRGVGQLAFAARRLMLAVLNTLVNDPYAAVVEQAVRGRDVAHAALEPVVVACYLVPAAHEPLEVELLHRTVVNGQRTAGTSAQTQERKQK